MQSWDADDDPLNADADELSIFDDDISEGVQEPLLETNLAEDFLSLFAPLGEEGGDAAAAAAAGMTDPP